MASREDVEVRLKLTADGAQASRALQDVEDRAKRVDKATQGARESQRRLGDSGAAGAVAGAMGGGGNWRQETFKGVAAATFAVGVFTRTVEAASKATLAYVQAVSKGQSGTAAAVRGAIDTLLFGIPSTVEGHVESIRYAGSKASAATVREQTSQSMAQMNLMSGARSGIGDLRIESAQANAMQTGEAGIATRRAREARAYARLEPEGRARYDADIALQQAQVGRKAASAGLGEIDRQIGATNDRLGSARESSEFWRRPGGITNQFVGQIAGDYKREADTRLLKEQAELQRLLQLRKQSQLQLDEKSLDVQRKKVDVSKAELAVVAQKEQRAKASQESFGLMSGGDKAGLLYSLRQAKNQGFGTLTEEQRGMLAGNDLTSDFIRKEALKSAGNDPVYQEILRLMGGSSFEKLREQRVNLEANISVESNLNEAQIRRATTEALDKNLELIRKIILDVIETQMRLQMNQPKQIEN